jgi:carboxypeptidase Q
VSLRGNVLIAALLVLAAPLTPAVAKRASTSEDRTKAVTLARELEENPTAGDAVEKRRWLVKWYEKVPDITITICDLLGPLPPEGHPFFPEVLVQSIFSQGAFIIEHPDQAGDEVAVQTAGMVGALKVYERLSTDVPAGRLPFLEDMLKRRDGGTLPTYMAETVPKACK